MLVYNAISIEGPQDAIDKMYERFDEGFSFEALFPVPKEVTDVTTWKKANWGEVVADNEVYLNSHRSTRTVRAGIMIGFESVHPVNNWVKHVALENPELDISLGVDISGKEDYVNTSYHEGKKVCNQPTLF